MPIYEYICTRCHKTFEILRQMSEVANIEECPFCRSPDVRRHWTSPNIIRAPSTKMHSDLQKSNSPFNSDASVQESKAPFNGIYMENVTVENCGEAGIAVENSKIRGKNVKLRGNKTGLRAKNSIVEIDGLDIK